MELWELSAREEIRETLARYHHAGDSGRFEEMAALFAVDGVLEIAGEQTVTGRAAIVEFLTGVNRDVVALSDVPMLRHYSTNVTITVESATGASARSAFLVLAESGLDHWGRYRDRLVPADGSTGTGWRFALRTVRTDGYAPGGWAIRRRGGG
jgi:SnoaL-like domain